MAFIGFLTSYLSVSATVASVADQRGVDTAASRTIYVSLFISLLIAIFATVLCFIVQAAEWYIEKRRRLAGVFVGVVPLEGQPFAILLEKTGSASRFSAEEKKISRENVRACGKWVQFPEGTVVRWRNSDSEDGDNDVSSADMGIISISDEYLVYQGYRGRIRGEPIIVGHIDRRAEVDKVVV